MVLSILLSNVRNVSIAAHLAVNNEGLVLTLLYGAPYVSSTEESKKRFYEKI